MEDKYFYEQVAEELRQGNIDKGIWAKSIAKSDGNENKAKSIYIQLRAKYLIDKAKIREAKIFKKELKNKIKNPAIGVPVVKILLGILIILFGLSVYSHIKSTGAMEYEEIKNYNTLYWIFTAFTFLLLLFIAGYQFILYESQEREE